MRKIVGVVVLLLAVLAVMWAVLGTDTTDAPAPGDPPSESTPRDPTRSRRANAGPASSRDANEPDRPRRRVARGPQLGGLVLDTDGTPAADVEVAAFTERLPEQPIASTRTDVHGRFDVTPFRGHDVVALRARSHCSDWTVVAEQAEDVTLRLHGGATSTGHVRVADGQPAAGATVHVEYAPGGNMSGKYAWVVSSDDAGRYRVSGIPEGWWIRPCIAFGDRHGPGKGEPSPFGFFRRDPALLERGEARIAGGEGDVFERDLVAQYFPAARVQVELRFPDGAAVPSEVVFESWWGDDSGFGHMIGERTIAPRDPRLAEDVDLGSEITFRVHAGSFVGKTEVLRFDAEGDRAVTIEMRPAPRIVARLVHPDGTAATLPDVEVSVGLWHRDGGSGFGATVTDADGRADLVRALPIARALEVPDAEVVFTLAGPGVVRADLLGDAPNLRMPGPELAARIRSADGPLVIDIPLIEPNRLVVQAVDADGEPVEGVALASTPEGTFWPTTAVTGADGCATFELLARPDAPFAWNDAAVRASTPWQGAFMFSGIGTEQLREGGHVQLTVLRQREYTVHVVDEDGSPMPGAYIRLGRRRFVTDAEGNATVPALPGSQVQMGMANRWMRNEALPEDRSEVTLVARKVRTIRVRAAHPDDSWRGVFRCVAECAGESWLAPVLDVRESAEAVTRLIAPPGPGTVTLTSMDLVWGGHAQFTADDVDVTVRVARRPLHTVRLRFVSGGIALAAERVTLRLQAAPHVLDGEFVTDVNGEVRLELPAGDYGQVQSRVGEAAWLGLTRIVVPAEEPIEVMSFRDED